jgi:hypothetical protein
VNGSRESGHSGSSPEVYSTTRRTLPAAGEPLYRNPPWLPRNQPTERIVAHVPCRATFVDAINMKVCRGEFSEGDGGGHGCLGSEK